jgi:outer membrane protein assembly factor BamB
MLRTLVGGLVTGLLLLLRAEFFSRLPGRARLGVAVAAIGAAGAFVGLFRIRGVSGDLLPVIESRFAAKAPPALPPPAPAPDATPLPAVAAPGPTSSPAAAGAPAGRPAAPPAEAREEPRPTPASSPSPAWPQFLGPNRDATVPDVRLARDWNARPPRLVWRQPIGAGWSSFAIVEGLAVTQEQRDDQELVVAYDLATGKPRWSHADRARYDTVIAGVGPRATPTVHEGRVFAQGATGILNALDLRTGRRLWSHQIVGENGAELPTWGKSGSPLVLEGRVIVSAGGKEGRSLVAYDASSGEPVWAGGTDTGSYSSPFLTRLGGRTQVVVFGGASVAGHDPATGERLWEHPFPGEQPNVAQPLPLPGDRLLLSAGYGVGSKVIVLSDGGSGPQQASLVWETTRLKSKFANLILHEGFVYGLDDGVLTCLDPATGERRWKAGRYGHGQLLLVGGLLFVQTEEGEGVLVEPTPEAHRELTRRPLLEGKTWNPPALAGRLLLVRNDREAALYEVPLQE